VIISSISLRNFRNLANFKANFSPGFNVIAGNNGQGKTNLLEAVHWLGHLRPLRTTRVRELIRWKEKSTMVEGSIEQDGLTHHLKVAVENGKRSAYLEHKKTSALNYNGHLSVVLFTPSDLDLIKGSPEERRRFIDRSIFNLDRRFLSIFLKYRQALDSRNECLRKHLPDELIEAYEITMASYGLDLMKMRRSQLLALRPFFDEAFRRIMGFEGSLELSYRSILGQLEEESIDALASFFAQCRSNDRQRGFTQKGPHTDDFTFKMLDHSAKHFASQGQQRALVLATKISEILHFKEKKAEWPVLLLDDVSSELDPSKNQKLFQFLNDFSGQVFITTTNKDVLNIDHNYKLWRVSNGVINSGDTK
jgi:DNA replication and repair protein RecF